MKTKVNPSLMFLLAIGIMADRVFAETPGRAYFEQKTDRHVVRVSHGPGEPRSIGSYSIHVYGRGGFDLVAGVISPRDGEVARCWVTDLDQKNELGIWIWTRVVGSGSYGKLALVRFAVNCLQQVALPTPDQALVAGYMGHDVFDVVEGKVYREFPVYGAGDSNSKPTGGTRCLELDMEHMEWRLSDTWHDHLHQRQPAVSTQKRDSREGPAIRPTGSRPLRSFRGGAVPRGGSIVSLR